MNASALDRSLSKSSKDTGIPKKDLKNLCLRAGLELLQKGELVIKAKPKRKPAR